MHLQNKKEWKLQKICKKEIVENLKLTSTHTNYNLQPFLVQFNSRGEKTPDFIIWREFPAPSKTSLTARSSAFRMEKVYLHTINQSPCSEEAFRQDGLHIES